MANPSRSYAIILALQTQLQDIRVGNDYLTDVGENVWITDGQRTDALGLMIYSESITGPGIDLERPTKPVRDFTLLIEAAIGTDLDDAQLQIHNLAEDIEVCMASYARQQKATPPAQQLPMHVADIAILDRPEGAAVIALQARIVTRYFR